MHCGDLSCRTRTRLCGGKDAGSAGAGLKKKKWNAVSSLESKSKRDMTFPYSVPTPALETQTLASTAKGRLCLHGLPTNPTTPGSVHSSEEG